VKEGFRIEKQTMETKLKETLLQKAELQATFDLLKEQYEALKHKKESEDTDT
jgi:hypothetical protein